MTVGSNRHTLDELFARAVARITRHEPLAASSAASGGALLIDIRSEVDRERDGTIPRSLHIPRTVLEWRADPDGARRNPHIGGLDQQIIVVCDHGFSSVFAADMLVELGFSRAGDLIGGYIAWREAGLPTKPASRRRRGPGELAGMGPPGG